MKGLPVDFKQLLAEILAADTLPETAHDDLIAAYELDLSIPNQAAELKDETIAALKAEVTALKIRIHDLIEYGQNAEPVGGDGDTDTLDNGNDADEDLTIADLFDPARTEKDND